MAVKFTQDQQNAIGATGGRLIVSAAAGSGKTAVLVERVINMICNGQTNVSELLVVTFTEAAAGEMKHKITKELLNRLKEQPKNHNLRRQLTLMPSAKIQTVHAFCNGLIKANFNRCGVSYDFELLDDGEGNALIQEVLEGVFEQRYADFAGSEFQDFFDNFSTERGDRELLKIVLELYKKLRSHPNPEGWCRYTMDTAQMHRDDRPENHNWGRYLLKTAQELHRYALHSMMRAYEEIMEVPEVSAKYATAFALSIAGGQTIDAQFDIGWDEAWYALRQVEKQTLSPCRYEDKIFLSRVKAPREKYYKILERLKEEFITLKSDYIVKESNFTAPIVREICRLVIDFGNAFSKAKAERNVLDFSDLEHMALGLLCDRETGEKTPLALRISGEITELLVDEFQDTNEIQDRIFDSIRPHTGNVFYVGDVKQSIYKFRLANPTIFVDKYKAATPFAQGKSGEARRIDLNQNFRSRTEVLGCTNFVFQRIMTEDFGDINYDETQALHLGADYSGVVPSELSLLNLSQGDEEDEVRQIECEAAYVAQRIQQLLQTFQVENADGTHRKAQAKDFAILLSSYSSKCGYFEKELTRLGVPCASQKRVNFIVSVEISCMMAFLQVIDNSFQDIPMVALMRSPFYGFTVDEIAQVKLKSPGNSIYEGLKAVETPQCQLLLTDLLRYKQLCRNHSVATLIELIYMEKQVKNIFSSFTKGEERVKNLETLWEMAESYEKSSAKGLFRFLAYVDRRFADGKDENKGSDGAGVQIMSIHKSKGLEYPVVFLPDLTKRFNTDDLKSSVLFHEDLQIGIKYRSERMQVYKSQMHSAIGVKMKRELAAEEMRKLYVAMTRAKEKLILVASVKNPERTVNRWAELAQADFNTEAVAQASDFASWLGSVFLTHPDAGILRGFLTCPPPMIAPWATAMEFTVVTALGTGPFGENPVEPALVEGEKVEIAPWASKKYPLEALAKLPSKLSPTSLKLLKGQETPIYKKTFEKTSFGGAEKGNAIHRCMELLDLSKCNDLEEISGQVQGLYTCGKLSQEQVKLVSPQDVLAFFNSQVGQLVKSAKKVLREQQFAALFTPDELFQNGITTDGIVVNGVIDMMIFDQDRLTIIDYKSDYVPSGGALEVAQRHKEQIDLYAIAATKLYGLPIAHKYIYLFSANQGVEIL